jgi:hypothetical protein
VGLYYILAVLSAWVIHVHWVVSDMMSALVITAIGPPGEVDATVLSVRLALCVLVVLSLYFIPVSLPR